MSAKNCNVVDDWERLDDIELNTKLDQLKKDATYSKLNPNTTTNSATEGVSIQQNAGKSLNEMLINDDDNCLRTPYAPPEPTVKILKRPTNEKTNKSPADTRPKVPVKTLQQREQEYAEARLRILGAAKSAEEEEEENAILAASVTNGKVNGFSDTNGSILNNTTSSSSSNSGNGKPNIRNYNPVISSTSKPFGRNYQPAQQQQQQQPFQTQQINDFRRLEDNIIRLPRGPDGTSGFLLKR